MNVKRLRLAFSLLVLVTACGVLGSILMREAERPDVPFESRVSDLESYWPATRRAAAAGLAQHTQEPETVVPALVKALGDSDVEVRLNALTSLRAFGPKAAPAVPAVIELLGKSTDANVRQASITLLGVARQESSVPALVAALDDADQKVQVEACRALGSFGPKAATDTLVARLIGMLGTETPEVLRDAAIDSLQAIAPERPAVFDAVRKSLADDRSPAVRTKAVALMGKAAPASTPAMEALLKALDDPSPQVRLAAGGSLARIGLADDRVVPALCAAARKTDDLDREGMATNLERLVLSAGEPKPDDEALRRRYGNAVKELRALAETPTATGREEVLGVLGRLIAASQSPGGGPLREPARDAMEAILGRARDEKEGLPLRLQALRQWDTIQPRTPRGPAPAGTKPAPGAQDGLNASAGWIAAAAELARSPAEPVRRLALTILAGSLNRVGPDASFRDAWRKAAPTLAAALRTTEPGDRTTILSLLAMLGPEAGEATDAVRAAAKDDPDEAVRSAAVATLRQISSRERLKSSDPKDRVEAASDLGAAAWRAGSAVPALIETASDPDPKVRLAAIQALGKLGAIAEPASSPLAAAFAKEQEAPVRDAILQALEAIGPAGEALSQVRLLGLRDASPQVRKRAATVGTLPRDQGYLNALGAALKDADAEVRGAAAASLSRNLLRDPSIIPKLEHAAADPGHGPEILSALGDYLENSTRSAEIGQLRGDPKGVTTILEQAIPAIRRALSAGTSEASEPWALLLARLIGVSRSVRDSEAPKAFEPAIPMALDILQNGTAEARTALLESLADTPLKQPAIVTAAIRILESPDPAPGTRALAIRVIDGQLQGGGGDEALREAATPAVPILMRALDDAELPVRERAMHALGSLGEAARPAEAAVRRLSQGAPQPSVKNLARQALKAITEGAKMPPMPSGGGGAPMSPRVGGDD